MSSEYDRLSRQRKIKQRHKHASRGDRGKPGWGEHPRKQKKRPPVQEDELC